LQVVLQYLKGVVHITITITISTTIMAKGPRRFELTAAELARNEAADKADALAAEKAAEEADAQAAEERAADRADREQV